MNIPKVLGTAFFVEQFQWLLINYVLVSERILKKESREIAFDLISLSHVQIKAYKQVSYYESICLSSKIFKARS